MTHPLKRGSAGSCAALRDRWWRTEDRGRTGEVATLERLTERERDRERPLVGGQVGGGGNWVCIVLI